MFRDLKMNSKTALASLLPACLLVVTLAHAESFSDPTRPPQAWLNAHGLGGEKADSNDISGARVVVIGKHQRFAVVDGQVVKSGDNTENGQVVSIQSNTVVVKQGDERKSLSLTPGVEKTLRKQSHTTSAQGARSSGQ